MEKYEKLSKIENIEIKSTKLVDPDYSMNLKIQEGYVKSPIPILILYLDVSRIAPEDVDEFGKRTAECFTEMLSGTGWFGIVIPIFSGQDSRIEVATVSDIPQDFEEFKDELLKRVKEINGSK